MLHIAATDIDVLCNSKKAVCMVFKRLELRGNYSATSNSVKLVHLSLMGGLLHLVQREPESAQAPRCTKCNSPPING